MPSLLTVASDAAKDAESAAAADRRVSLMVMQGLLSGSQSSPPHSRASRGMGAMPGHALSPSKLASLTYSALLMALQVEREQLALLEEGATPAASVVAALAAPEEYLTPLECLRVLEHTPEEFASLPTWRRLSLRKKARLHVRMVAASGGMD